MTNDNLKRSSTKLNVIANIFGRLWTAIVSLAFVPIIVRTLGEEAYGLIGFYISLFTILNFLDLGLSTAINRKLSVLRVNKKEDIEDVADTLKTFEGIYFIIGLALSLAIIAVAPLIASAWLDLQSLSFESAVTAIRLMGVVLFFQWPMTLYMGGFLGLEKQIELNIIKMIHTTLQWAGSTLVLIFVMPTIEAFFISQIAANLISNFWLRHRLWAALRKISGRYKSKLSKHAWLSNRKFIGGLSIYAIFFTLIGQIDRIVISKTLPLTALGHFTVAMQVAGTMMYIGLPIYFATFPRISRMINEQEPTLNIFYHKTAQILGVLTVPISLLVAKHGEYIIYLWVGDETLAKISSQVVSFAIIGVNIFVFTFLPLSLMLALKWTRPINIFNGLALLAIPYPMYRLIAEWGLVGAPIVLGIYFIAWHLILVPLIHRRVLQGELKRWFVRDLLIPIGTALATFAICELVLFNYQDQWTDLIKLMVSWMLIVLAMAAASPEIVRLFREKIAAKLNPTSAA